MALSTQSSRSSSGKSDLGWDRLWGRPMGFVPSNSPKRKPCHDILVRDAAFEAMLADPSIDHPPKTNSSKSRKSSSKSRRSSSKSRKSNSNSGKSLSPIIPGSGPLAGATSDPPDGQMSEKRKGKQIASSSTKNFLHDVKNRVKALKITKIPKEAPRSRTRKPEPPDHQKQQVPRRPNYIDPKPNGTFTISAAGQIAIGKKLNKELTQATSNHLQVINEALDRTRVDLEKSQSASMPFLSQDDLVGLANSRALSKLICQVIEEQQDADMVQAFARDGFSGLRYAEGGLSELFTQFVADHFLWVGVRIGLQIAEKREKKND